MVMSSPVVSTNSPHGALTVCTNSMTALPEKLLSQLTFRTPSLALLLVSIVLLGSTNPLTRSTEVIDLRLLVRAVHP